MPQITYADKSEGSNLTPADVNEIKNVVNANKEWKDDVSYSANEMVNKDGILYVSNENNNYGNDPASSDKWYQYADYLYTDSIENKRRPGVDPIVIPKGIYEEYTNLVQDPCDLTTGNWSTVHGVTATSTDITVKGYKLTKLEIDGTTDPQIEQGIVCADTETKKVAYFLLRNGNMTGLTETYVLQSGASAFVKGHSVVDWANKSITTSDGELLESNWLDDNTVELWLSTETGESGHTTWQYRIDPNNTGDGHGGEYIYATACMLVDNTTTMFSFVNGTHSADTMSTEFTLPDKFTFDMIIEPKFSYDTSTEKYYFDIREGSSVFRCYYTAGIDKFVIAWLDGGTARYLVSQRLDDGSSYTDLNQRFRLIGSIDLTTGTTAGSRFISIPLESGSILEDTTWTGNIDVKSTNFDTLYIGSSLAGTVQADSEYEYLRFYSGTLTGDINSSVDADVLLEDKSMIFEAIPNSFIKRTIEDNTSVTTAIQNLANDFKTGVGIRDNAILGRHLYGFNLPTSYDLSSGDITHTLPKISGTIQTESIYWTNGGTYKLRIKDADNNYFDYEGESEGHILLESDGSNWQVREYKDSMATPQILVTTDATQTISGTTATDLNFNTLIYSVGDDISLNTSSYVLTINSSGFYTIDSRLTVTSSGSDSYRSTIAYILKYSTDGGTTWQYTIADGYSGAAYLYLRDESTAHRISNTISYSKFFKEGTLIKAVGYVNDGSVTATIEDGSYIQITRLK